VGREGGVVGVTSNRFLLSKRAPDSKQVKILEITKNMVMGLDGTRNQGATLCLREPAAI
jgi:hypothetical protein